MIGAGNLLHCTLCQQLPHSTETLKQDRRAAQSSRHGMRSTSFVTGRAPLVCSLTAPETLLMTPPPPPPLQMPAHPTFCIVLCSPFFCCCPCPMQHAPYCQVVQSTGAANSKECASVYRTIWSPASSVINCACDQLCSVCRSAHTS